MMKIKQIMMERHCINTWPVFTEAAKIIKTKKQQKRKVWGLTTTKKHPREHVTVMPSSSWIPNKEVEEEEEEVVKEEEKSLNIN